MGRFSVAQKLCAGWMAALLLAACGTVSRADDDGGDEDPDGGGMTGDAGADAGSQPTCEAPEMACGETCVDVATDPANCGACGHDCGDGLCAGAACQPVTIADQIDGPYAVAVTPSGDQVFWLTSTTVHRCASVGCTEPALIADLNEAFTGVQKRNRMVATDQEVFWLGRTTVDVLMSCPAAGCSLMVPSVKAGHELDSARSLVMAGSQLLVGQRFQGRLCEQAGGCADVACISADSIQSIVADDATVYWMESTDPGGLYSCPRVGSGTPLRLTAERGQVVRLLGEDLYVLRSPGDGVYRCAATGCSGAGTPVLTGELNAGSLAIDETGLYWTVPGSETEATGEVRTCPLAGCGAEGPRVLASGQAQPTDITLAGPDVLWVNQGLTGSASTGAIMRVRR